MMYSIITMGAAMAVIILAMFRLSLFNVARAQSIVFTSLVVFELVRVQAVRSRYEIAFFTNKWLSMAILSTVVLQILLLYSPLNVLFGLVPLGIKAWLMILAGLGIFALWFPELKIGSNSRVAFPLTPAFSIIFPRKEGLPEKLFGTSSFSLSLLPYFFPRVLLTYLKKSIGLKKRNH